MRNYFKFTPVVKEEMLQEKFTHNGRIFLFLDLRPFYLTKGNHLCIFGSGHYVEHSCEIV